MRCSINLHTAANASTWVVIARHISWWFSLVVIVIMLSTADGDRITDHTDAARGDSSASSLAVAWPVDSVGRVGGTSDPRFRPTPHRSFWDSTTAIIRAFWIIGLERVTLGESVGKVVFGTVADLSSERSVNRADGLTPRGLIRLDADQHVDPRAKR